MIDAYKYVGTPYEEGLHDCYTLAQRFYLQECGLALKNYARPQHWHMSDRFDFFSSKFQTEGFYNTGNTPHHVRVGDALLMGIGDTQVLNHVAIYVGANKILHHLHGDIARVDCYTDRWRYRVKQVIRHPQAEARLHVVQGDVFKNAPPQIKFRSKSHAES